MRSVTIEISSTGAFIVTLIACILVLWFSLADAQENISQLKVHKQKSNSAQSPFPINSATYKYTGSSDFRKHQSRKVKYQGPGLDFDQISTQKPRPAKKQKPKMNMEQLRSGGKFPSVFTQQLRPGKFIAKNVTIPSLEAGTSRYCSRPPGSYTFEQLFIPTVPGIPPIAIINNAQEEKEKQYDPANLFIKPATTEIEEKDNHGVTVEVEPHTDVSIEVSQH